MYDMNISKLIIWFLIVVVLTSCYIGTPNNIHATVMPTQPNIVNIGDGGLISQKPCGPPCYQGINLGMNVNEAAYIIQRSTLDNVCSIYQSNINCGLIRSSISFDSTNTTVNLIIVHPETITASDIIDKYGSPNWFDVESVTDELGHSTNSYLMKLYYDDLKMIVELESQDRSNYYTLIPDTKVVTVVYQEVWWQDDYLPHDWHGYGTY
jgi:hypothetical protein